MRTLVPNDFDVPVEVTAEKYKLHHLSNDDAILSYEALMSSIDHLQGVFDPNDQPWPTKDLTPNFVWAVSGAPLWDHFTLSAFHYGVFNLEETEQLGQVSIEPSFNRAFDARVVLWVRKSEYEKGFDSELFKFVKKWLEQDWPLEKIAYPGRDHDWADFSRPKFVDDSFEVPNNIVTPEFNLSFLGIKDFLEDGRACKLSQTVLSETFGRAAEGDVEPLEVTSKLHLGDLSYCEWTHYQRRIFSYVANDPKTGQQLACVYVWPTHAAGYDCELYCWVTEEDLGPDFDRLKFDANIFNWARVWVDEAWPFENVACPGREIDWKLWFALPEK